MANQLKTTSSDPNPDHSPLIVAGDAGTVYVSQQPGGPRLACDPPAVEASFDQSSMHAPRVEDRIDAESCVRQREALRWRHRAVATSNCEVYSQILRKRLGHPRHIDVSSSRRRVAGTRAQHSFRCSEACGLPQRPEGVDD